MSYSVMRNSHLLVGTKAHRWPAGGPGAGGQARGGRHNAGAVGAAKECPDRVRRGLTGVPRPRGVGRGEPGRARGSKPPSQVGKLALERLHYALLAS